MSTPAIPVPYNPEQISLALDTMTAGLEKMAAGLATLRNLLSPTRIEPAALNPKDPANKYMIGGLEKLTPRGVEVCYRLFDQGVTRYGVSQAMDISFGAADHRHTSWTKAGGLGREKKPLD